MSDTYVNLQNVAAEQGYDGQKAIVPGSSELIDYEAPLVAKSSSYEFAWDSVRGALTFITPDGTFEASGFLTQSNLGRGKVGKKGLPGRKGRDGYAGFEGRKGKVGCAGIPGVMGIQGEPGLDAEDGPRGPVGPLGCGGDEGPTGPMGIMGATGPAGARGARGSSCLIGPTGPTGPTPITSVVFSDSEPTNPLVYIWGQLVTVDTGLPTNPVIIEQMRGSIPSRAMTLSHVGGDFYEGIAAFTLDNFSGGKGPFEYKWTGDFLTMAPNVYIYQTGDTSTNMNLRCRVYVAPGTSEVREGQVILTIKDTGDQNKTLTLTGTFKFSANNAATPPTNPPGGGGGGGCIPYGQTISAGRRKVLVESVYEADTVDSVRIAGLPDSSDNDQFLVWTTTNFKAEYEAAVVMTAKHSSFGRFIRLNGTVTLTSDENILIQRNGVCYFERMYRVVVGDKIYHESGQFHDVTKVEIIEDQKPVVSLNVETTDVFFVSGYLIHNLDNQGPIHKV